VHGHYGLHGLLTGCNTTIKTNIPSLYEYCFHPIGLSIATKTMIGWYESWTFCILMRLFLSLVHFIIFIQMHTAIYISPVTASLKHLLLVFVYNPLVMNEWYYLSLKFPMETDNIIQIWTEILLLMLQQQQKRNGYFNQS
jgi:hypothetical protein